MEKPIPITDVNPEKRILDAARKVFIQKGYAGARMQEIADEAEINKALLHYYFRSKDKLFEVIFKESFGKLIPRLAFTFREKVPLALKIERFVTAYISVVLDHPYLPVFVLSEIHRNPDQFFQQFVQPEMREGIQEIITQIQIAVNTGEINPINPRELMINIMSLSIFPFVGRPMIQRIMGFSSSEYDEMLTERGKTVSQFILQAITPNAQQ
jgi:AcrR family transcriptional regulator